MLGLLDLFDTEDNYVALSFDEIHARVGYTRSTLYRYLKALSDAGLLSSLPGL
ncbi:helix-turn-helix domain-containing protein, partial [Pseudochelatococcus sp. B33]